MVFGSAVASHRNALENLKQMQNLDFQSCLFPNFAPQRLGQPLTRFDSPSGQRPISLQRLSPALYEQDSAVIDDERTNPWDRPRRESPGMCTHAASGTSMATRSAYPTTGTWSGSPP